MRTALTVIIWLGATVLLGTLAHLAVIEVGREVVTLRTQNGQGDWRETRLWIVDHDGAAWLHSAGPQWATRFEGSPVVEVRRGGEVRRFFATLVPEAHPDIDKALEAKYGVADRWVRLIAPCGADTIPVRLDPVEAGSTEGTR